MSLFVPHLTWKTLGTSPGAGSGPAKRAELDGTSVLVVMGLFSMRLLVDAVT
jgi:hypothetical protein